ncbi:TBC1 domain family member 19-like [Rhopilema esculentum]|uniref:TBC1 domain family member 19-like n=1 Tax=Rhopilema esculentum TaxID=499914 RepID=UPI0031DB9BD6
MEDSVLLMQRLHEYIRDSGLYFQLKKAAQDELTKSASSSDMKKDLIKVLKNSGYDVKLQNEVFRFQTHPANLKKCSAEGNCEKDPLDYMRKAQTSWEKCITKSINSMCTELVLPLARKRSVKDQETFATEFNALRIGSHYDEEGSKKLRPVYSSADFFEALITVKNANYTPINKSGNNLEQWRLIKPSISVKDIHELRKLFLQLDRQYPQCGIDDVTSSSTESFLHEWQKLGAKVVRKGHSAAARQYAKQGCPTGLRKKIWMCILGMEMENLDMLYYEQLKNFVFEYDLLVDKLIMKDVRLTTTNDDSFFVFEDIIYQVLLIFSRDTWLLERCNYINSSPPKSYVRGNFGIPELQVNYPPSGVIPFHGFAMYAAPLCYIYEDPMTLYYVFRELYFRYFCRLHVISSDSQGVLALCSLFENLLQSHEPWLFKHILDIGGQPLRIVFNWIMFAFSGYLATDQTLQLWDRIFGFDSLELLPVLAVAILSYRRENLLAADTVQSLEAVLADLSTIKVIPLIVSFLAGKKV